MRGDRLKHLRESKGYTQETLAEMVNAGTQQIWRWESGSTEPNGDFIYRLAKTLGTSSDYLLGLTDNPSGLVQEESLSSVEQELLHAYRTGRIWDLLNIVTKSTPANIQDQEGVVE